MTPTSENINDFAELKHQIDAEIEKYSNVLIEKTVEEFGEYPSEPVKAYTEILSRGGKRIRGALTITGYKMFGGTDCPVALRAALVVEMLHAYILIIDDIQDRSETRRGGDAAHVLLEGELGSHFGQSIAMNAALIGLHSAINVLESIDVDPELRLSAIRNVNERFLTTLHGQTQDIYNEVSGDVTMKDINNVLLWKTAYYTFLNPLQLGAILAGASNKHLESLEEYSMHAGRLFQITDDILGVFGDSELTGKSAMDDIREGKRSILTVKALELATESDSKFLKSMLGNRSVTDDQFRRCRTIIEGSGALKFANDQAEQSLAKARQSTELINGAIDEETKTLSELLELLITRKS